VSGGAGKEEVEGIAAVAVLAEDEEAREVGEEWNDRGRCRVARASRRAKDGASRGRIGMVLDYRCATLVRVGQADQAESLSLCSRSKLRV
jgi:hypothetical protein